MQRRSEQAQNSPIEEVPLTISPRTVFRMLIYIALALAAVSLIARVLRWFVVPNGSPMSNLLLLLDVNLEHNFPSYYSALLLLICAAVLGFIGVLNRARGDVYWHHWGAIGAIFFGLSMDEAMEFHGHLNDPVARVAGNSGILYYGWVLPALIFVGVLSVVFFRFLAALPREIAIWFVISGAIYITGAVGFEMAASLLMSTPTAGWSNPLTAAILEHAEELLEMVGISLFLYALLRYLRLRHGNLRLELRLIGSRDVGPLSGR